MYLCVGVALLPAKPWTLLLTPLCAAVLQRFTNRVRRRL
jgi:hypothetical protein